MDVGHLLFFCSLRTLNNSRLNCHPNIIYIIIYYLYTLYIYSYNCNVLHKDNVKENSVFTVTKLITNSIIIMLRYGLNALDVFIS